MKVLAIETATVAGSAAILDSRKGLIGELKVDVSIAYAERLTASIDLILKASCLSINDMDAFAVSIGPGSFTGLRIGLSTIKGLSYATGKPVVPVPTLDAFASTIPFCHYQICPMLDARRNEVYAGRYRWDGNTCVKIMPETAISPVELIKSIKEPTVFTGNGAVKYKNIIQDTLRENALFAPASRMTPSASSIAEAALEIIKKGELTDPAGLTPFYARKSEAEINWKK